MRMLWLETYELIQTIDFPSVLLPQLLSDLTTIEYAANLDL